jgi:hypothetical protein
VEPSEPPNRATDPVPFLPIGYSYFRTTVLADRRTRSNPVLLSLCCLLRSQLRSHRSFDRSTHRCALCPALCLYLDHPSGSSESLPHLCAIICPDLSAVDDPSAPPPSGRACPLGTKPADDQTLSVACSASHRSQANSYALLVPILLELCLHALSSWLTLPLCL